MTTQRRPRTDLGELERHVTGFPREFSHAWAAAAALEDAVPPGAGGMVIVGIGGSAAAADMVRGLCLPSTASGDITVLRHHDLPRWASGPTLVVVCSYSGETREALMAFDTALAQEVAVAVITSGGTLGARAKAAGVPCFTVNYVSPPRHSLAWMIAPLLRLAIARGLVKSPPDEIERAALAAAEYLSEPAGAWDTANALAEALLDRVVVITGAEFLAPVARRWKNQLNENGKHLAFADELPEAAHNTVEGWDSAAGRAAGHVIFNSAHYSVPASLVTAAYTNALTGPGRCLLAVEAPAESRLGEMLGLTLLGDLVSLCTASAMGVDPVSIRRLDEVKQKFQKAFPAGPSIREARGA